MNKKQFSHLLKKYRAGNATKEESRFIESYYTLFEAEPGLEAWLNKESSRQLKKDMLENIWEKIQQQKPALPEKKNTKIFPLVGKVAAAVLVLLASGVVFYMVKKNSQSKYLTVAENMQQENSTDIKPGGNHAVLTLSNGQKIILDSTQNGTTIQQGNTNIVKISGGLLAYNRQSSMVNGQSSMNSVTLSLSKGAKGGLLKYSGQSAVAVGSSSRQLAMQYNTITTPRGGQYQIILPDGSKVWLNAASSLKFPMAFNGKTRPVTITGEAYFEIAPMAKKPFIVQADNIKIEVLGTHFNVNSYTNDNSIRTTLAEGSVRVSEGNKNLLLSLGQQANLDKQTGNLEMEKVNVDEALAWKNGLFYFDNTNIKNIMSEVARWYDVNIVYKTNQLNSKDYSGIISRYSKVEQVLERLSLTGTVHFKIEGRTIVVMN